MKHQLFVAESILADNPLFLMAWLSVVSMEVHSKPGDKIYLTPRSSEYHSVSQEFRVALQLRIRNGLKGHELVLGYSTLLNAELLTN